MPSTAVVTQIIAAARAVGLPPALALGQGQTESGLNQASRGAAGEIGIFQIMPNYWRRWALAQGWDIYSEEGNIRAGVAILAAAIHAEGSVTNGLRRYNGGPGWRSKPVTAQYAQKVLASAQRWGDVAGGGNISAAQGQAGQSAFPVPGGKMISFWGDPRDGGARRHQGIDIAAPTGTPVVSFVAGKVSKVYTGQRSGLSVQVRGNDGRIYNYFHLSAADVKVGQTLGLGELLGKVGQTGNARTTPPHLHFEIRDGSNKPMDPKSFLDAALHGLPVAGLGGVASQDPGTVDIEEMLKSLPDAEEDLTQVMAKHFEVDPETLRPQIAGLSRTILEALEARAGTAVTRNEVSQRLREQEFRSDPALSGSLAAAADLFGGPPDGI